MDNERLLNVLQQENILLRERVAALEDMLIAVSPLPVEWGLTASEARVFGVLVNRELATKEAIMAGLYIDRAADEAEIKIVDVFVCKIRKKLSPFDVQIHTRRGEGYWLNRADRDTYRRRRPEAA